MSAVCEVCDKHPMFGNAVARLGRRAIHRKVKSRTSRRFSPNIQRVHTVINGTSKRIKVCTSCLKKGKVAKA